MDLLRLQVPGSRLPLPAYQAAGAAESTAHRTTHMSEANLKLGATAPYLQIGARQVIQLIAAQRCISRPHTMRHYLLCIYSL